MKWNEPGLTKTDAGADELELRKCTDAPLCYSRSVTTELHLAIPRVVDVSHCTTSPLRIYRTLDGPNNSSIVETGSTLNFRGRGERGREARVQSLRDFLLSV